MAKEKRITFFCKECGHESAKWLGQCPGCREWNTFVEMELSNSGKTTGTRKSTSGIKGIQEEPVKLSDIRADNEDRISTEMSEFDRVLGGGIVKGSMVLVGGDPGIGKSTLLLQMCRHLAKSKNVLYISGEESLKQIKLRADRIGDFTEKFSLYCETNLDNIEEIINKTLPDIVIIDSIQTMYKEEVAAAPGSVGQVRESTFALLQLAKGKGIAVFIVGHVTKEGMVAGPRMLEHMVDTVLYFEGERHASYRVLRGVKNRFGSTNEIGVFEMQECGLVEVTNPSEYMLAGMPQDASGSVVTCAIEGTRPMLLEIQALVCRTNFGMPRRTAAGIDYNRVNLLMAVLEKRLGFQLSECDAYVNVTGGMKMNEPAMDLGIVMAIISSYKDMALPEKAIVFGEIGLTGEVRGIPKVQQRIAEAERLGYKLCIVPRVNISTLSDKTKIKVIGVTNVKEAVDVLLKNNY
ncbi:MAG: DNA repair protein RadA [Lachnospiraceae bacterium]|nr:DNA repair protein RadA [Lachnospiraceae bacterium]